MATTVHNLRTGEEQTYTCEPERAVASAWLIEHKRAGDVTREDSPELAGVIRGRYSVAAGDWAARI